MFKSKILLSEFVTHNVKRFIIEKPANYKFIPGQATDFAINLPGWEDKIHSFTFTSLNSDLVLEFTIKGYPKNEFPSHSGMTEKLHSLKPGDEVLIGDPWGTINYMGKGVFIAGGAGITPFIAILRDLKSKDEINGNKLVFSNNYQKDIILEQEFKEMFAPKDLFLTLTKENISGYFSEKITVSFLNKYLKNFNDNFYICGPKQMVEDLMGILVTLGAKTESVVFEE